MANEALKNMVERLDAGQGSGRTAYVTTAEELIAILQEVSPLVPVSIQKDRYYSYTDEAVGVLITVGFALDRNELEP